MKKAKEFRDMSEAELEAALADQRKDLFEMRNKLKHDKKMEKPHQIRQAKKEIARVLTVLSEKQRQQTGGHKG